MTADQPAPSSRFASGPSAAWLAYAVVAMVWGFHVVRNLAWDLRFEDALIVLRYARHLVAGDGFVFNLGERVLGVTTPLHTLLSTLWVALGGEAAPGLQNTAGVCWLVVEGALAMAWLQRLGQSWAMLPVGLLILGNYNLNYLFFGMETHAFAALVLAVLWLAADSKPRPQALGMLLGVAFLVRYDAALLALLVGVDRWARDGRPPVRLTVAFFAVVTPWLVFAQLYFGSILPQPLDAKEGFAGVLDYGRSVLAYYRETWARILATVSPWDRGIGFGSRMAPWVISFGAFAAVVRDRRAWLAALYPVLHLAVYAGLGSDPGFRWHVYVLNPLGFVFFAVGVTEAFRWTWRWGSVWGQKRLPTGLRKRSAWLGDRRLALGLVVVVALPLIAHLNQQMRFRYRPDPLTVQLTTMGQWLRQSYPPTTTLVHPAIGILGWESGLQIIDHAGLVTPGLFFYNDQDATPLAKVVEHHDPDLILLSQWSPEQPAALGYRPVHRFEQPFVYTLWGRASDTP